jgi:hypothetical protein
MAINELQDFRLDDLYAKLRLMDEEFEDWLVSMGFLNSSMNCTCGLAMKKKRESSGRIMWSCNRALHRSDQPRKGYWMKITKWGCLYKNFF